MSRALRCPFCRDGSECKDSGTCWLDQGESSFSPESANRIDGAQGFMFDFVCWLIGMLLIYGVGRLICVWIWG